MGGFNLKARAGWRDTVDVPKAFTDAVSQQATSGGSSAPHLLARLFDEKWSPVHADNRTDLNSPGGSSRLFDDVGWLPTELSKPGVVRAELVFVNVSAMKPNGAAAGIVTGRPVSFDVSGAGLPVIEKFVNAVADSLHPSGTHGAWASCEWAVLEIVAK